LYERSGDVTRAIEAYEMAAGSADREVRRLAAARLAVLLRRGKRYDDAAAAWQSVLSLASDGGDRLTPLERRAAEALAIHHEHRARDLPRARRYAEVLRAQASGRAANDAAHRLSRLNRKIGGGLFPV
jgi:tetratricopeptide (TPR) repeat protein